MTKLKKGLLLFMLLLLLFFPLTSLAANGNTDKTPNESLDAKQSSENASSVDAIEKDRFDSSNSKKYSKNDSNLNSKKVLPLNIENLSSEVINKEPPKVEITWLNPSTDTDLSDNGWKILEGYDEILLREGTVENSSDVIVEPGTTVSWNATNLEYNTYYQFCVNQIYNDGTTSSWQCTAETTPEESGGGDISNPPPVENFSYDLKDTDPPSADTEWKNPDYEYFSANGWEIHEGWQGNIVNQGKFTEASAGKVETSTVTDLDYDTYYILRRNVISEDGSESEWESVSFTTPQKDDDGGDDDGGDDDGGGGGGSDDDSSGCIISPSSSFGMGWLLLLTVPGLMILRRFSK